MATRKTNFVGRILTGIAVSASVVAIAGIGWKAAVHSYGLRSEISDLRIGKLADQQKETIEELSAAVAQLNDAFAQKEQERASLINSHASEIEKIREEVRAKADAEWSRKIKDLAFEDKDWSIINSALLEMYSYLVWTSYALEENRQKIADSRQQSVKMARSMGRLENRKNDEDGLTYVAEIIDALATTVETDNEVLANASAVYDKVSKYKDTVSSSLAGAGLAKAVQESDAIYFVLAKYPRYGVNLRTGQMRELYADLATMPSD